MVALVLLGAALLPRQCSSSSSVGLHPKAGRWRNNTKTIDFRNPNGPKAAGMMESARYQYAERRKLRSSSEKTRSFYFKFDKADRLLVDINCVMGTNMKTTLQAIEGLHDISCSDKTPLCNAKLDMEREELVKASLPRICTMLPLLVLNTQAGQYVTEGLKGHRVDELRSSLAPELDGTGMTIGILSDSFDTLGGYQADIATGDLPPSVEVVKEFNGTSNDEGRALAQIAHDLAPGAQLLFRTVHEGVVDAANGIRELGNRCDVMVDAVFYTAEPFFQDGEIAQAVDEVVQKYNVPFFSSAGNYGHNSWEGDFNPSITLGDLFPGVPKGDCVLNDFHSQFGWLQTITLDEPSQPFSIQWDDPQGAATHDIDVLIFNENFTEYVGGFFDDETAFGHPFISFHFYGWTEPITINMMLCMNPSSSSARLPRIKWVSSGNVRNVNPATNSPTILGQSAAKNAAAVGAADFLDVPAFGTSPPKLATYSSRGGAQIRRFPNGTRMAIPETRYQPRFVGVDCVLVSFFVGPQTEEEEDPSLSNYLCGTSASAAHVAAIAVLLRQQNPHLTPLEVYAMMETTAVNMGPPGWDVDAGHGLVDAYAAVAYAEAMTTSLPSSSPSATPSQIPTNTPTQPPSASPAEAPSAHPATAPSEAPTVASTSLPTASPPVALTNTPVAPTTQMKTGSLEEPFSDNNNNNNIHWILVAFVGGIVVGALLATICFSTKMCRAKKHLRQDGEPTNRFQDLEENGEDEPSSVRSVMTDLSGMEEIPPQEGAVSTKKEALNEDGTNTIDEDSEKTATTPTEEVGDDEHETHNDAQ